MKTDLPSNFSDEIDAGEQIKIEQKYIKLENDETIKYSGRVLDKETEKKFLDIALIMSEEFKKEKG